MNVPVVFDSYNHASWLLLPIVVARQVTVFNFEQRRSIFLAHWEALILVDKMIGPLTILLHPMKVAEKQLAGRVRVGIISCDASTRVVLAVKNAWNA